MKMESRDVVDAAGDPWAKNSSDDGVPYYVSRDGADTSWDHPMLSRVLMMLEDCNRIDYAAYRAATKLRMIQKRLNWDSVNLYPVSSIMQHHALKPGEADTTITIGKVSAVISDIFAYIAWIGAESHGFSFDLCSELTLNLFINIFDKKRRGQVRVLSVQTFLCLLCKDRPLGKLRYLFRQVSDHNNCCSRVKLATLLKEMSAIMEYLDEGWKFGLHTVGTAVESCFSSMCLRQANASAPLRRQVCFGLTEEKYLHWMAQQPQNLVWLFINQRLADSEHVEHNAQCRVCRQSPIVGLCYVCLQCWNVQLCQTCFLLGRVVSGHKKSHHMEEHSVPLSYSERFVVAINRLLSVMRLSRPCLKKGPSFLPLDSSPQIPGDLVPVLAASDDDGSSRDGNPSPLPPPPPPPPQSGGGSGLGSGSGPNVRPNVGPLVPSCSSRSSGVVVDCELEDRNSNGNWFSQSPNPPPPQSGSATSTDSCNSPQGNKAVTAASGNVVNVQVPPKPAAKKPVGRPVSGINILPTHQRELQSILWHFEEEQKQLRTVLGTMDSKTGVTQGATAAPRARVELEECSHELEAQLARLRTVLKNYMRFSVIDPVNDEVVDRNGAANGHDAGNGDIQQPLESTAVSTPAERGAVPISPIPQSQSARPDERNYLRDGTPSAANPGKVIFREKRLPLSLQMRTGMARRSNEPDPNNLDTNGNEDPDAIGDKILNNFATPAPVYEQKAPLAEVETLGSFSCIAAQFPSISLGDISTTLLSMTQDLDIPRGSPCTLPYDQQAKRVSLINRELEGILRELDAVYPSIRAAED